MPRSFWNRRIEESLFVVAALLAPYQVAAQQPLRIEGRLTATDGRPVQGDVTLVEETRFVRAFNHRPDSQGRFAIQADASAAWLLVAKADGYISSEARIGVASASQTFSVNFLLAPTGEATGQVVDEAGRDVTVQLATRGGTVRGRLRDAGGTAAQGVTVRLRAQADLEDFSPEERSSLGLVLKATRQATTGSDGSFGFRGVPAGKVTLVAEDAAGR